MHTLQEEFDYDSLRVPPEYYEIVEVPAPEWKVTWDGDFFDTGASTPVLMYSSQTTASEVATHMAMSSLHFEPAKRIEWRIVFQEIPNEDLTVSLI